jgi:hypothetical protein
MPTLEMGRLLSNKRGSFIQGGSRNDIYDQLTRAGGHTSSDFSNLLADVANKSLLLNLEQANPTYKPWVPSKEVADYKTQRRVSLGSTGDLPEIKEGGEYQATSASDNVETYSIAKYGDIFNISREALINDDMNALDRVPRMLISTAVRKTTDLVYDVLTTNGNMSDGVALFHADHGNLGSSGALSAANLASLVTLMRKQTALGGGYLSPTPRFLIVPPELEYTARALLNASTVSQENPAASGVTSNSYGATNPFYDLSLIVEPRLSDSSTTAYYLAAADVDHLELGYLSGTMEGVSTETQDSFTRDGLSWKVRLEVGCGAIDYRGIAYDPGT